MKQKLKIESGKFYRTRDGRKAGVYRTDANGDRPIHGYIIDEDGGEYAFCWNSSGGSFDGPNTHLNDLTEEYREPLDFDWDCLPKWADKYIAKTRSGQWYSYATEPETSLDGGVFGSEDQVSNIPSIFRPKKLHRRLEREFV